MLNVTVLVGTWTFLLSFVLKSCMQNDMQKPHALINVHIIDNSFCRKCWFLLGDGKVQTLIIKQGSLPVSNC